MTEGGRQNLPDKNPGQNSPKNNPRELRQTLCKDIGYVCMNVLLKIGGSREWPRCVTKCDRGKRSKFRLVQNSVSYFMVGPLADCLGLKIGCYYFGPKTA